MLAGVFINLDCDFLIIGAGIVGLSIARELKKKKNQARIIVIDKESKPAFHASGRNSGVLHAGFYYSAESLKAQFCKAGNEQLTAYCLQHGLAINPCGKLVLASDRGEQQTLEVLFERARQQGIAVAELSPRAAQKIEPRARVFERALFSPTTASINPLQVATTISEELTSLGVDLRYDCAFRERLNESTVVTSGGTISSSYLFNSAGLYADSVAKHWQLGLEFKILPFKGLYLYADTSITPLNCHIYPVPNLANPFLGVHFTITAEGKMKVGPTAIPALWREQYQGFSRFNLSEFMEILWEHSKLLRRAKFDFRKLAFEESKKYFPRLLLKRSAKLLTCNAEPKNFYWGPAGIRAQLIDHNKRSLLMDFEIRRTPTSTHILNAVSPAFTCSFPFAQRLVQEIL